MKIEILKKTIVFSVFVFCVCFFSVLAKPSPSQASSVGVADENAETVFTSSEDGRTIYMWQYFSSKPPRYVGSAEAIEQVDD